MYVQYVCTNFPHTTSLFEVGLVESRSNKRVDVVGVADKGEAISSVQ
jgi:hypothetical protein